jgi:hypothetical protein
MCTNSTKDIPNNKDASNTPEEVEQYFPGFLAFIDSTEQQIPRPIDGNRRKMYNSGKKKRHTVKNQLMVNNHRGYILHKANHHTKRRRHDYDFYKNNHPVTPSKQVVNVFDLGYLGVEKDFPEQLSSRYHIEGKETNTSCPKKKKRKQNSFQQKENSDRTYYLSIEKVQDYERYL